MNFIEEFQQEKEKIKNIVNNLKVLDREEKEEILKELENDKIKIAVIGQMKYGKSTFINSFIFHSNYLPTSSTPMTAALSEIKYADSEEYEVHFFTEDEFNELKKIEEFKDILEKAERIPNKYSLFGTKKIISRYEFENYVGADGLYTPIVKMLTIYSPKELLKDAIVVDTPGFNDPIESRDKIAEGFIKEADFIILFLYAGKPFDSTDRSIIIDKLQYLGKAGKVIFVVNKADLLLDEYGSMDAVNDYIKKILDETIEDYIFSDALKRTLKEAEVVSISSLMALISRVSEKELRNDEILFPYFQKFREDYRIESREELEDLSQIKKLENIIKDSVKNEKLKILIQGIKQRIIASLSKKIQDIESEIRSVNLKEKLNSLEEIKKSKDSLKEFKEKEYKNEVLPVLIEADRKVKRLVDNKLVDIYNYLQENKNGIEIFIRKESNKGVIKNKFSNMIKLFNNEFREKILDLLESFRTKYETEVEKSIDTMFGNLEKSKFAKEFDLTTQVLNEIKSNLLNIYKYELVKDANLNLNIPEINDRWWIFGDSIEEIKNKFFNWAMNNYFTNAERILESYKQQLFELIHKAFDKKEERGVIIREFNKAVIEPIDKTLQRRENELKELKNDIKTDKQMLNKLKSQLQALNKAKEKIERELI